jgi:phage tail-like protein
MADMAPAVASQRAYLRSQLPEVFRAEPQPVAVSLLLALEQVLDPIVAVLDALPAYLEPELAPSDALRLLAAWLGVASDDEWLDARRRGTVRDAARLARLRGTRAGLELALEIAFPALPVRVEDAGGVRWRDGEVGASAPDPAVTVVCDTPLDEHEQLAIDRLIDENVPAGVRARLWVRPRRRGEREEP